MKPFEQVRVPVVIIMATAILGGCASIEAVAPPVTASMGPASKLVRGRELYVGRCAACHHVEPVSRYGASEWRDIIADMAERSKLTPSDEEAVLSYVLAAREAMVLASAGTR